MSKPKTLTRTVASLGVHDHACLIYESYDQQQAALASYFRAGLDAGEPCAYVADELTGKDVLATLERLGILAEVPPGEPGLTVLTSRDSYLREGVFDPDLMIEFIRGVVGQTLEAGFPALRGAGEMSWNLAGEPGSERIFEYEAKLNVLLAEEPACLI